MSLERVANAITDTVPHGDDHDAPVHPGAAILTHMAAALRHGGPVPVLPDGPIDGVDPILERVLREAIGMLFGASDTSN